MRYNLLSLYFIQLEYELNVFKNNDNGCRGCILHRRLLLLFKTLISSLIEWQKQIRLLFDF